MASAGKIAKRRRVLIVVENLPVPFDRRVWQEALALREADYTVRIICPAMKGYTRFRESLDGIEIYRHPLPFEARSGALGFLVEYSFALVFQLFLTLGIYIRHGFDAIHACNPPDTIFLLARLLKPLRVKFLFDQHDINPELYLAKYDRQDFFYRLLLWLEHQTYRTADVVISTNESYRSIALARGNKLDDDVFIVRSAPDTARFHPVSADDSLRRGRRYLVAYLGVMGRQEGLDLLLDSIRIIVHERDRTDISFLLIGSGPEIATVIALSSKLKLDDYVTFTGRIPDHEVLTALSTADVCVNPDRFNAMNDKSTMNKILEYMAVGKPIVQFDLKEGRYSADNAALYARPDDTADFADKILTLLANQELRATMGNFGLSRLKNQLSWSNSKVNLLRAYDKLFGVADSSL